jgi:hypothetical protein
MARNHAIQRALSGKLNLGVLCVALGAAAFLESGSLLAVGVAAFFGMVARDVYAEERRLHHCSPRIPEGATFENMAIRLAVDGISAAQKERLEAIKACPDDVLRLLGDVLRASSQLETTAILLARRTDRLHGYLSRKDMIGVRDNLYSSQQAAQISRSAPERAIHEAAARSYAVKVETLGAIEQGIRVSLAKLSHMHAALAVVPPTIMKLAAASAEVADPSYERLSEDLFAASGELQEAEARLASLVVPGDEPWAEAPAGSQRSCVRVATTPTEPAEDVLELEEAARPARRAASHVLV